LNFQPVEIEEYTELGPRKPTHALQDKMQPHSYQTIQAPNLNKMSIESKDVIQLNMIPQEDGETSDADFAKDASPYTYMRSYEVILNMDSRQSSQRRKTQK